MKTFTECIEELKKDLGAIDTKFVKAQKYSEMGECEIAKMILLIKKEFPNKPNLDLDNYSKKALQAVWNVADILSIVVAMPVFYKESLAGIVYGLMFTGISKNSRAFELETSLNYLDPFTQVPIITNEQTYEISKALLTFINNSKLTENGPYLIGSISSYSKINFGSMEMTLVERVKEYEVKRSNDEANDDNADEFEFVPVETQDDLNDTEVYHDALTGEEEYFDTLTTLPNGSKNLIQARELVSTFVVNSLGPLLEQNFKGTPKPEKITSADEVINCIRDLITELLSSKADLKTMQDILTQDSDNLERILNKNISESWSRPIMVAYEVFKKGMNDLFETCGFGRPLAQHETQTLKEFKIMKNSLNEILPDDSKQSVSELDSGHTTGENTPR